MLPLASWMPAEPRRWYITRKGIRMKLAAPDRVVLRALLCGLFALLNVPTVMAQSAGSQTPVGQPQWELWRISPDGTGLARFADTPGYSCGSPKFSPDGTWVAYDTRRIEEDLYASQVAVIRADGTGRRLLGPGSMPSWSPDGKQLAIHTYQPSAIVIMNADGTGRETLTDHFGSPRWLQTGNRIAVVGRDGGLAIIDLATGIEHGFMPGSVRPGFAASSNGLSYVFGNNIGGLELATLNPTTMQVSLRKLWTFGHCYHAAFSPGGKRVVFGWKRDPPVKMTPEMLLHQIYILDLDTNGPPTPLAGQDPHRNNTNPDWSPDGKTIIFSSQYPPPERAR